MELLDILSNSSIWMQEVSKLSPSLVLGIFRIEFLLKLFLESIPSGGIGSHFEVITPTTLPNKGNIIKGERSVSYLSGLILDVYSSKVGFKSPKEVVNLPYVPYSIISLRSDSICFWGDGHLG